jgi:hypothetical protein
LLDKFIYDGDQNALIERVSAMTDGISGAEALPSHIDPSHIQEGVVIRYESDSGTDWLKSKSFVFLQLEELLKESDDYIDAEEIA